jgi:hypothetical protein
VVVTSGNTTHGIAVERLIPTEVLQTDLEGQRAVIHWPIVKGQPADKSTSETATTEK